MKRWRLLFSFVLHSSTDLVFYLAIAVVFPLLILTGLGFYYLWLEGKLLWFVLFWLLVTLVFVVARYLYKLYLKRKNSNLGQDAIIPRLTEHEEWTSLDRTAWRKAHEYIDNQLAANPSWEALQGIAVAQQSIIASVYFPDKTHGQYNFTLPELLLMLEVTSKRYRKFIKEHLPYADNISVAKILSAYAWRPRVEKGYRVFSMVRRLLRLSNPASALAGEMKDFVSAKVLDSGNLKLQFALKQVLLEELAQVAMDLYSGRLRLTDEELIGYVSKSARQDAERQADPVEQLRVVVIGQSGAGKSSLINSLTAMPDAEVDVLPSTSQLSTHQLRLNEVLTLNLIDTPGIDGRQETRALLLDEAVNADILLWVCKATQPGRAADQLLLERIRLYFTQNVQRVTMPLAVVMTHSDRLRPPGQWHPGTINAAKDSIAKALQLEAPAVVLPTGFSSNSQKSTESTDSIEALKLWITSVSDKAINAQLNRRRVELGDEVAVSGNQFRKLTRLAKIAATKFKSGKDEN